MFIWNVWSSKSLYDRIAWYFVKNNGKLLNLIERNSSSFRYTYPHIRTGLCAMSQPYEVSMFTRIRMFMSLTLLMGILAISVIAFAVFSRREGYAKAGLQVLRIMVGVGILHPPKINSARIFLCTMLILFLNVNAFFQSHWSSLLTIPIFYSNTDSSDSIKVMLCFRCIRLTR